ncbi:unnamed protein product [Prunus armeniaca]|uniref:Uncharacterized protein n=1 Tax=Prunus armeniaca TaxID=36596 RepID=A0A6J5W692_PRUAR|nr:unnamed protein product [Prunus armeniaca]
MNDKDIALSQIICLNPQNPQGRTHKTEDYDEWQRYSPELDHTLEAELEHPPEVAVAPSKAGAAINLKILINGKDLNTTIAEDIATTP